MFPKFIIYTLLNSKELYEFDAHEKAQKLWIDKETIASMAPADNHLGNSIVDVWSIIMINDELSRQKASPNRFYFTIYVYVSHVY